MRKAPSGPAGRDNSLLVIANIREKSKLVSVSKVFKGKHFQKKRRTTTNSNLPAQLTKL